MKKKKKKVGQIFFSSIFRNCPKKGNKGDANNIVNALQVILKRMKQKRPATRKKKKFKIFKIFKKYKKNQPKFFLFYFSKLPPKRCPGGLRLYPQCPQSVFEEDEAEEATEKSSSKCWTGSGFFYFQLSTTD